MRHLTALACLLLLVGCHRYTPHEVQVKLSSASVVETGKLISVSTGKSPSEYQRRFVLFEGKYPTGWPSGISLPSTFHYVEGKPLKAQVPSKGAGVEAGTLEFVRFSGIAKGTETEVIAHFKKQFNNAGWTSKPLSGLSSGTALQGMPANDSSMKFTVSVQPFVKDWVWCAGLYTTD